MLIKPQMEPPSSQTDCTDSTTTAYWGNGSTHTFARFYIWLCLLQSQRSIDNKMNSENFFSCFGWSFFPLHQILESTGMFYFQNKAFRSTYQYLTRKRRIQVKLVRQKCGEWGGLITLLSGSPWPTGERRSSLRVWEEMPEWRQGGCPALRRWGAIWSSHRECTLRVCWFAKIDLRKFSTTKS